MLSHSRVCWSKRIVQEFSDCRCHPNENPYEAMLFRAALLLSALWSSHIMHWAKLGRVRGGHRQSAGSTQRETMVSQVCLWTKSGRIPKSHFLRRCATQSQIFLFTSRKWSSNKVRSPETQEAGSSMSASPCNPTHAMKGRHKYTVNPTVNLIWG